MAKLVHSYWTRPSMGMRWGYRCEQLFFNLWYFALSCAYARRIGAPIVLHTDTLGERLFGYLPYDNIYTTLDAVEAPPKFWAAGKFYAMQAEEDARAIHIDGDVFIKRAELWEKIANSEGDILVQCVEHWSDVQSAELAKYMKREYFAHDRMLNTGVLGIFNQELKDKIVSEYMRTIAEAKRRLPGTFPYESPDLVCEQQMIAYMSQGYKVDRVIDERKMCVAQDIGYQHVLSSKKYECLPRCRETLKRVDIDIYNQTMKICQDL